MRTMQTQMAGTTAQPRLQTTLLGVFAVLAAALAVVSVYGVVAYTVAQRVPEIGVRLVLGASPSQVVGLVVWDGARLLAVGLSIGLVAAALASRTVEGLLFAIKGLDPLTFVVATLLLGTAALFASLSPRPSGRVALACLRSSGVSRRAHRRRLRPEYDARRTGGAHETKPTAVLPGHGHGGGWPHPRRGHRFRPRGSGQVREGPAGRRTRPRRRREHRRGRHAVRPGPRVRPARDPPLPRAFPTARTPRARTGSCLRRRPRPGRASGPPSGGATRAPQNMDNRYANAFPRSAITGTTTTSARTA